MAQLGNCCEQTCCVNDAVCCHVQLSSATPAAQVIWTDTTSFVINGTIVVENQGQAGSPSAAVTINGAATPILTVPPGGCQSVTVNDVNSISIAPAGPGTGTTTVKISFSLNYKF